MNIPYGLVVVATLDILVPKKLGHAEQKLYTDESDRAFAIDRAILLESLQMAAEQVFRSVAHQRIGHSLNQQHGSAHDLPPVCSPTRPGIDLRALPFLGAAIQ